MIPILYSKTATEFSGNGIGFLKDALKCRVTEERNGAYELELQYPITGQWYSELCDGGIVKAKANETSEIQCFRIYKTGRPINGMVTYGAEHISYDANGVQLAGFSVGGASPQVAIQKALDEATTPHNFTVWSDISTLNGTTIVKPCSIRALLGGQEGSVLDVWGGEYEFDNFTIKLHRHRGFDRGVIIEYGKNIKDLKQESNISSCYTHIMPYAVKKEQGAEGGAGAEEYIYLADKKVIAIVNAEAIGHMRVYPADLTDKFGETEEITPESLRVKAVAYVATCGLGAPAVNLTVSFVQLWQTEEYKNIAPLERVCLCDEVTIRFAALGVDAKAKVIKTVYDSLKERYEKIELGDAKANFADTANKTASEIQGVKDDIKTQSDEMSNKLAQEIAKATALITGQNGGYVVLNPSENPQEILIMDTPDIATAVNVWRWNSAGLGHSSNGYNGPFELAMTMDGAIVADKITAGELNGIIVKAGTIRADALSIGYKNSVTNEINQSAEEVEQKFTAADGQLLSTVSETLKSYSTTTQMNSAISQTSSTIMLEVNKKVNNADFGTKITQNYTSVQIAWNNISKYIEFSGGAMNIYQSTAQGSDNLLMKMNYSGAWYYYNGTTIGKIGTNAWSGDSSFRGLVFDLEYGADYMCWAHRTSSGAGSYTVQLIYYANNSKARQGLHFSCNTYCWGNLYLNENVRTVNWSGGGAGLYSTTHEVGIFGKTAKMSGGCSFECTERRFAFWNSPDLIVDCYNNIDIHNYSILNQSDARLKTNIQPTSIDALSLINRIDLKEYDWIESGEHDAIGIIAQQLQGIIPELVDENAETGRLSIKSTKFIPYLVKAIQELSSMNARRSLSAMPLSTAENWEDTMPLSEKIAFIEQSKFEPTPQTAEIAQEEILIPIRNGGSNNG